MKVCDNCQVEFEPKSPKQKFCSDKCKVAFSRKKARGFELPGEMPKGYVKSTVSGELAIVKKSKPNYQDLPGGGLIKLDKPLISEQDLLDWAKDNEKKLPEPVVINSENSLPPYFKKGDIFGGGVITKANNSLTETTIAVRSHQWVIDVENYCTENDIEPYELLNLHRLTKLTKEVKEESQGKVSKVNFALAQRKNKCGF